MLDTFRDIAPKAVLASALVWAGAHYFVVGPEVATRVARADYLPMCESNLRAWAVEAGKAKEAALSVPSVNPSQNMAAAQLRAIRNNPFLREMERSPLGAMMGLGTTMDIAASQFEERKRQAENAYSAAVEMIRKETATNLGKAGSTCCCIADAAINAQDWAIFTGTLGFFRPASVSQFGARMQKAYEGGMCRAGKAGA